MNSKFEKEANFLETASATTLAAVMAAALYKYLGTGGQPQGPTQVTPAMYPKLDINELSPEERNSAFSGIMKRLGGYDKNPNLTSTSGYGDLRRTAEKWFGGKLEPEEKAQFYPEYLHQMATRAFSSGRPEEAAKYIKRGTDFYATPEGQKLLETDTAHREGANRFFNTMLNLSGRRGNPGQFSPADLKVMRSNMDAIRSKLDPSSESAKASTLSYLTGGGNASDLSAHKAVLDKLTPQDLLKLTPEQFKNFQGAVSTAGGSVPELVRQAAATRAAQDAERERLEGSIGYKIGHNVLAPVLSIPAGARSTITRIGQRGQEMVNAAANKAIRTAAGYTPLEFVKNLVKGTGGGLEGITGEQNALTDAAVRDRMEAQDRLNRTVENVRDDVGDITKGVRDIVNAPGTQTAAELETQRVLDKNKGVF